MKLYEIKWEPTFDGIVGDVFFENGLGASVVCRSASYGGEKGLFEVALLRGTRENSDLINLTDEDNLKICPEFRRDEVDGWLPLKKVEDLLNRIERLDTKHPPV
tara:strand:+ start:5239 stop:5550 length:312 start_codon:yes stop_codon:yes gene_type:complete